jgi:hypothetical protein
MLLLVYDSAETPAYGEAFDPVVFTGLWSGAQGCRSGKQR